MRPLTSSLYLLQILTNIVSSNTTKNTPCQLQSMHSLRMLIAENITLPQLLHFRLWMWCKWDLRLFGMLCSVDLVSGQLVVKFSQQCWWRFKSSGTFHPVVWLIHHLQGQQSEMKAPCSIETSATLHQLTRRNLHVHLCENVMSHRIEDRAGPYYCVWRAFYGSAKIIAASTKAPYGTYFSFRALWCIKTHH